MQRAETEMAATGALSRRLFLQGLAVVYAIAFVSLWVQVDGLIGSDGILPAAELLDRAAKRLGPDAYWRLPTLLWLGSGDAALHALCALGVIASALVLAGIVPAAALFAAWCLYLSLVAVGDVFLSFQWDTLLLETGLIACLFAPCRVRPRANWRTPVPIVPLWALRWLLFRLVFASAIVKLASGDPTWRDLTALQYHYFTQPLPVAASFYAHHLPAWLHIAIAAVALAIEGIAPLLIFGGQRLRTIAAAAITALMGAIAATGNYGFFNLLTVCLCILLLDDQTLRTMLPAKLRTPNRDSPKPAPTHRSTRGFARAGRIAAASIAIVLSTIATMRMLDSFWRIDWPGPLRGSAAWIAPLRSANAYGLFAVMTTHRPEIQIEGSRDGEHWQAYRFRWKPGRLDRAPGWVQPHMPRLDWQMWFAALGNCSRNQWFGHFAHKLLESSTGVTGLLANDPFGEEPPRYIRSTLFRYRFAPLDSGDAWWQRKRVRTYCPVFALDRSRLIQLGPDLKTRLD